MAFNDEERKRRQQARGSAHGDLTGSRVSEVCTLCLGLVRTILLLLTHEDSEGKGKPGVRRCSGDF